MSELKGRIGKWQLTWKSIPRGPRGTANVQLADGKLIEVSWVRDEQGLWIQLPGGCHGFDIEGERSDDGRILYSLRARAGAGEWSGLSFLRAGEDAALAGGTAGKKITRVRAQMPGKILRVAVKAGDSVEKGQSLLVMEAMKMENEIRAPQAGKVAQLKIGEGQAVESGADLLTIDPA